MERDRAIAECDRLMAARATSSSEQTELSRQRGELLAERDQLLGQQQALQTENEKVHLLSILSVQTCSWCSVVVFCMLLPFEGLTDF